MTRATWHACALCGLAVLTVSDLCPGCRYRLCLALVLGLAVVVVAVALVREATS